LEVAGGNFAPRPDRVSTRNSKPCTFWDKFAIAEKGRSHGTRPRKKIGELGAVVKTLQSKSSSSRMEERKQKKKKEQSPP